MLLDASICFSSLCTRRILGSNLIWTLTDNLATSRPQTTQRVNKGLKPLVASSADPILAATDAGNITGIFFKGGRERIIAT